MTDSASFLLYARTLGIRLFVEIDLYKCLYFWRFAVAIAPLGALCPHDDCRLVLGQGPQGGFACINQPESL
jgi:hypothetical protein